MALDQIDLEYAVVCFETAISKILLEIRCLGGPQEDLVDEVLTYNQLGNALSQLRGMKRL